VDENGWPAIAATAGSYLSSSDRVLFLGYIASALTLTARECYVAGGGLAENAGSWLRCHNEVQHQLTNHLNQLLGIGQSTYQDEKFVEVLLSYAAAFGCLEAVQSAIAIANGRMSR
jgi:hypothetical protein